MAARVRKKKRRRTGGGGFVVSTLSFLIICAAIVFAISVFFRVSDIEVEGTDYYTSEEIIEASGIKEGDSLVTLHTDAAESRISGKLIYAGRVEISKKMPDTVIIKVWESGSVACVDTDEGTWTIDNYCRLLEPIAEGEEENYIEVTGVSAVSPQAGSEISVSAEDKPKAKYLESLLSAMTDADMLSDVASIDVSNSANAQFSYMDRFTVKMGTNEDIDYKLQLLKSAIAELDDSEEGTFDLSENKKASFNPD